MRLTLAAPVLLSIAVVGCGGSPDQPGGTSPPVEVTEAKFAEIDAAVARAKGSVVLVDFWATWCGPCVKKFPELVALHKEYAGKGLACMSVSMDDPNKKGYSRDKVLDDLKGFGATFPNFILVPDRAEAKKMDARFGEFEGIPYMAMFDRTGKRVWTSDDLGSVPPDQRKDALVKRVEEELAK